MEQYQALNSEYVIDGVRMDSTPAAMLDECLDGGARKVENCVRSGKEISDETPDRPARCTSFDSSKMAEYSEVICCRQARKRDFELAFPEQFTRRTIAQSLLDAIWTDDSFTLRDLSVELRWKWNSDALGNMAAFHASCAAAADYLYDLDIALDKYSFDDGKGECQLECIVRGAGKHRICSEIPDEDSCDDWLIYIPFDTCSYRLGGSLLSRKLGSNGDVAPEICDPDWFMDCYEVVRELVEDGIVTAGTTVCDGGLMTAIKRMCDNAGLNLSGLSSSCQEKDTVRLLFSEVPGVLIRIKDIDYDYIDSQMILQDIAYYPLGHPSAKGSGISITDHSKPAISSILGALLNQASEGED